MSRRTFSTLAATAGLAAAAPGWAVADGGAQSPTGESTTPTTPRTNPPKPKPGSRSPIPISHREYLGMRQNRALRIANDPDQQVLVQGFSQTMSDHLIILMAIDPAATRNLFEDVQATDNRAKRRARIQKDISDWNSGKKGGAGSVTVNNKNLYLACLKYWRKNPMGGDDD